MRRKTSRKGFMAIKVDLEKAYDWLNWDFIFDTLQQTGIPIHLSRLIMECVTSASMSILWNGEATEAFIPGRGIRQGDPLSPYLFVLCIERLSHGITQAVMDGRWRPIRLAKYRTPLTHLFFADDLLLFTEASIDRAYVVQAVLDNYCRSSEAKNVATRDANLIGSTLGFSATNELGDYLGMPLIHSRVNKDTYQSILDKVDKRLTVTLAQSILQAMPIYAMQTTLLPSPVRHKIDKSCLGFKKIDEMNQALLMKLSWEVVSSLDKLWMKVFCSKYGLESRSLPMSLLDKPGSRIWKAIRSTWLATVHGARWSICDGA
ncbi:hypothetical protein KPL70_026367 [Citrus sinensis]|nr:hypothetical protein KPL70_026367 [Citrus sinensis]